MTGSTVIDRSPVSVAWALAPFTDHPALPVISVLKPLFCRVTMKPILAPSRFSWVEKLTKNAPLPLTAAWNTSWFVITKSLNGLLANGSFRPAVPLTQRPSPGPSKTVVTSPSWRSTLNTFGTSRSIKPLTPKSMSR